jgi:hypothetical protein
MQCAYFHTNPVHFVSLRRLEHYSEDAFGDGHLAWDLLWIEHRLLVNR